MVSNRIGKFLWLLLLLGRHVILVVVIGHVESYGYVVDQIQLCSVSKVFEFVVLLCNCPSL